MFEIPLAVRGSLYAVVSNYYFNGSWHFEECFLDRHPKASSLISKIVIVPYSSDTLIWIHSSSDQFSSKEAHRFFPRQSWSMDWFIGGKKIWKPFIPHSRSTLMWRMLLRHLPTEDSLAKAGLSLASSCQFCYALTESLAYLFLHCPYSSGLWDYFLSLFRVHLSFQLSPLDLFISTISWKASPQVGNLWLTTVVQILWAIWYARNRLIFEDCFIPLISSISFIHMTFKDCNRLNIGGMHNTQSDLLPLHRLRVRPCPPRAPRIIEVYYRPPHSTLA
ncbi:hypothetical protein Dsin_011193 [Dipteronia sinensis]|uniref:Reverse transcriptase zinc-binding domain-containing protein n=1 Tax=Dipteronia sinensis TaxID=43782 RepID=A0AAE0EDA2_9ROSI|nr:hypothetical protein Dsin_011193 [Dipteronia sinensis]